MPSSPPVEAVVRALQVLEALNLQPAATLAFLHAETGIPKPSIVRLLQTLQACGYVRHTGQRGAYRLTSQVRALTSGYHSEPRVVEVVGPLLDRLTAEVKWPAALTLPDRDAVVIRYSTIPDSPLSLHHSSINMRLSLVSRALGRAYLAFCSAAEREALIAFVAASDHPEDASARNRRNTEAMLEVVRRQGYALRDPQVRPVSNTLALPVFDRSRVVGSIGLTWFASTLTSEQAIECYLRPLQTIADAARRALAAGAPRADDGAAGRERGVIRPRRAAPPPPAAAETGPNRRRPSLPREP